MPIRQITHTAVQVCARQGTQNWKARKSYLADKHGLTSVPYTCVTCVCVT